MRSDGATILWPGWIRKHDTRAPVPLFSNCFAHVSPVLVAIRDPIPPLDFTALIHRPGEAISVGRQGLPPVVFLHDIDMLGEGVHAGLDGAFHGRLLLANDHGAQHSCNCGLSHIEQFYLL